MFYMVTKDVYIQLDKINYVRVDNFGLCNDGVHRYEIDINFIDDTLSVHLTREEWVAFQKRMTSKNEISM